MARKAERVKSIFDSDDSDDDSLSFSHSYLKEDEEDEAEANKLRKKIEEVCSSLGSDSKTTDAADHVTDSVIGGKIFTSEEDTHSVESRITGMMVEQSSHSALEQRDKTMEAGDDSGINKYKFLPSERRVTYNLSSNFCQTKHSSPKHDYRAETKLISYNSDSSSSHSEDGNDDIHKAEDFNTSEIEDIDVEMQDESKDDKVPDNIRDDKTFGKIEETKSVDKIQGNQPLSFGKISEHKYFGSSQENGSSHPAEMPAEKSVAKIAETEDKSYDTIQEDKDIEETEEYTAADKAISLDESEDMSVIDETGEESVLDETRELDKTEESVLDETRELDRTEGSVLDETGELDKTEGSVLDEAGELDKAEDCVLDETGELYKTEDSVIDEKGELDKTEDSVLDETGELDKTEDSVLDETGELDKTEDSVLDETEELDKTEDSVLDETGELDKTEDSVLDETGELDKMEDSVLDETGELDKTEGSVLDETGEINTTDDSVLDETGEINTTDDSVLDETGELDKNGGSVLYETDEHSTPDDKEDTASHESEEAAAIDENEEDYIASILPKHYTVDSALHDSEDDDTALHDSEDDDTALHDSEDDDTALHDSEEDDTALHDSEDDTALHDSEEDDTALHEREEDDIAFHEREDDDTALHDSEEDDTALHDSEEDDTALHEREEDDIAFHEREEDDIAFHEREEDDTALHDSEEDDTALHEREEDDIAFHEREEGDTAIHESEKDDIAIHESEEGDTAIYESEEGDTAIHESEEDTAPHESIKDAVLQQEDTALHQADTALHKHEKDTALHESMEDIDVSESDEDTVLGENEICTGLIKAEEDTILNTSQNETTLHESHDVNMDVSGSTYEHDSHTNSPLSETEVKITPGIDNTASANGETSLNILETRCLSEEKSIVSITTDSDSDSVDDEICEKSYFDKVKYGNIYDAVTKEVNREILSALKGNQVAQEASATEEEHSDSVVFDKDGAGTQALALDDSAESFATKNKSNVENSSNIRAADNIADSSVATSDALNVKHSECAIDRDNSKYFSVDSLSRKTEGEPHTSASDDATPGSSKDNLFTQLHHFDTRKTRSKVYKVDIVSRNDKADKKSLSRKGKGYTGSHKGKGDTVSHKDNTDTVSHKNKDGKVSQTDRVEMVSVLHTVRDDTMFQASKGKETSFKVSRRAHHDKESYFTDTDSKEDRNKRSKLTHSSVNDEEHVVAENEPMDVDSFEGRLKDTNLSAGKVMRKGTLLNDDVRALDHSGGRSNANEVSERRTKVRVEDIFTDSDNDTAKNESILQHPVFMIEKSENQEGMSIQEGLKVKKIRKRRTRSTSINLPAIMLAFEKGWLREVVFRGSSDAAQKRADVYYFSPDGKKLRSRVEVEEYLSKLNIMDLSAQNFSFFREPLGVEERYEKIRQVTVTNKSGSASPFAVAGDVGKKRMRKSWLLSDAPPSKRAKSSLVKKIVSKGAQSSKILQNTGNISGLARNDVAVYATHLFPCNPPLTHPRILTPLLKGASKEKTYHCTPSCCSGGGKVPNLQCVKCVCLFHPECCNMPPTTVSLIQSSAAKFLCPNCYREELENYDDQQFTTVQCCEPLAFDPSSESEDEGLCSDYEHPSYKRLTIRPSTPQTPTPQSRQFSSLHSPTNSLLNFTTPPAVSSASGLYPISSQSGQNMHFIVPVNNSLSPAAAPRILYLRPSPMSDGTNSILGTPPQSVSTTPLSTTFMGSSQTAPHIYPRLSPTFPAEVDRSLMEKVQEKKKSVAVSQEIPFIRGGKYFMEDMSRAYQVLRHIFSYLCVTDLLVVSRVCQMWRDLALGPSFWSRVRLRNVCVQDWDKMVEFLERRGTLELDLRKMVISIEKADNHIENLDTLPSKLIKEASGATTENIEIDVDSFDNNTEVGKDISDAKHLDTESYDKGEHSKHQQDDNSIKVASSSISEEEINPEARGNKYSKAIPSPGNNKSSTDTLSELHSADKAGDSMEVSEEVSKDGHTSEQEDVEMMEDVVADENSKELREKREKLVTSVLSEHDYFGKVTMNREEKHGDSSTSSSDDDTSDSEESESHTDGISFDTERELEEKLESHKKNVEGGNLKETLQWEHDPNFCPSRQNSKSGKHLQPVPEEAAKMEDSKRPNENQNGEVVPKEEDPVTEQMPQKLDPLHRVWTSIAKSLSQLRCLRSIVIGSCEPAVVEIILAHCHQLRSISALSLTASSDSDKICFDPSYLMLTKQLRELRLGSKRSFLLKSNFNFIKLPQLQILMLKGLKTAETGWPYMGIHLTHLHLSCINTFSHNNWMNLSSMSELVELELDGSGADFDAEICLALAKLTKLTRLALLDWNIGPKLPFTVRRLHNIKYLHVIPAVESQNLKGIYGGRLMVILDSTKHLEEFIWGIQPASRIMDATSGEKIYIQNMKPGKETGVMEGEEVRAIAIDSLKGFIKCRIPQTKVIVRKVAASNWITGDQGWH